MQKLEQLEEGDLSATSSEEDRQARHRDRRDKCGRSRSRTHPRQRGRNNELEAMLTKLMFQFCKEPVIMASSGQPSLIMDVSS